MAILYYAEDVKWPSFLKKRTLTRWIRQIAANYGKRIGEVSYLFCSEAKILEVNRQYLHHDYYTDIITFDYSDNVFLSGDIYLSPETVRSNAEQFGTEYAEEMFRVIIHGILHLCGAGDTTEAEQAEMRAAEDRALKILQSKTNKKEER
jgi:rRNA maturation RNase YbeY